ncbi:MAG: hypothetical protein Q9226_002569 [Calogaya cf. arnoldii]
MTLQGGRFCINSIAIVGGGPSGIAAAKYLLAENHYSKIKIFEQRASVGGVWNHTGTRGSKVYEDCRSANRYDPSFIPSPMYDGLESNIPLSIMQYSDFPFLKDTPLLPDWQTILHYLKEYAKDTEHIISFQQRVLDVRPEPLDGSEKWLLTSLDLVSKAETREVYDAVVVANGRYVVPYVPIVIVGYSSSGTDIGAQIESVSQSPILVSQKSAGNVSPGAAVLAGKELLPEIEEFLVVDRAIRFSNG